MCSGSTGAVSAATQTEYLSLLLELPFNKIFAPWPGSAGEGQEQGHGLALLQHGWLGGTRCCLWVCLSPCRGMAVSPRPPLQCGSEQAPWEPQWGQGGEGAARWGPPPGALSGLPSIALTFAEPQGAARMKM